MTSLGQGSKRKVKGAKWAKKKLLVWLVVTVVMASSKLIFTCSDTGTDVVWLRSVGSLADTSAAYFDETLGKLNKVDREEKGKVVHAQ